MMYAGFVKTMRLVVRRFCQKQGDQCTPKLSKPRLAVQLLFEMAVLLVFKSTVFDSPRHPLLRYHAGACAAPCRHDRE